MPSHHVRAPPARPGAARATAAAGEPRHRRHCALNSRARSGHRSGDGRHSAGGRPHQVQRHDQPRTDRGALGFRPVVLADPHLHGVRAHRPARGAAVRHPTDRLEGGRVSASHDVRTDPGGRTRLHGGAQCTGAHRALARQRHGPLDRLAAPRPRRHREPVAPAQLVGVIATSAGARTSTACESGTADHGAGDPVRPPRAASAHATATGTSSASAAASLPMLSNRAAITAAAMRNPAPTTNALV